MPDKRDLRRKKRKGAPMGLIDRWKQEQIRDQDLRGAVRHAEGLVADREMLIHALEQRSYVRRRDYFGPGAHWSHLDTTWLVRMDIDEYGPVFAVDLDKTTTREFPSAQELLSFLDSLSPDMHSERARLGRELERRGLACKEDADDSATWKGDSMLVLAHRTNGLWLYSAIDDGGPGEVSTKVDEILDYIDRRRKT